MGADEAPEQPGCSSQLPAPRDGVALSRLPDTRPTPSQRACLPGPGFQTVPAASGVTLTRTPSRPHQSKRKALSQAVSGHDGHVCVRRG